MTCAPVCLSSAFPVTLPRSPGEGPQFTFSSPEPGRVAQGTEFSTCVEQMNGYFPVFLSSYSAEERS